MANIREVHIAEETVRAIDFFSRLIGAIEDGNWHYGHDKLGQLVRALGELDMQLSRTDQAAVGRPVAAYVGEHSQHYRIGKALYGIPAAPASPVAQAEEAKRRRDLVGELGALTQGYGELTSARWYPARAGDVLHIAYEAIGDVESFGETYVVVSDEHGLVLKLLTHTGEEGAVGWYAPGVVDDPLLEPWMESGPHTLTVVRDGVVVHGGAR